MKSMKNSQPMIAWRCLRAAPEENDLLRLGLSVARFWQYLPGSGRDYMRATWRAEAQLSPIQ